MPMLRSLAIAAAALLLALPAQAASWQASYDFADGHSWHVDFDAALLADGNTLQVTNVTGLSATAPGAASPVVYAVTTWESLESGWTGTPVPAYLSLDGTLADLAVRGVNGGLEGALTLNSLGTVVYIGPMATYGFDVAGGPYASGYDDTYHPGALTVAAVADVPLPGALGLMALALGAGGLAARRRG